MQGSSGFKHKRSAMSIVSPSSLETQPEEEKWGPVTTAAANPGSKPRSGIMFRDPSEDELLEERPKMMSILRTSLPRCNDV